MNTISIPEKQFIVSHANEYPDQEVCGLILNNNEYLRIDNLAKDPTKDFLMPDFILPKYNGRIKAIYHSHWDESTASLLSRFDIINSRKQQIPYILYHTAFQEWDLWSPNGLHPWPLCNTEADPKKLSYYLRWPWKWGRADCLTLLRSYYKGMLDHDIEDFERVESVEEFDKQLHAETWNQYEENLGNQDLSKVCSGDASSFRFELHDIILMRIKHRVPHHVGIVAEIGNNIQIIHHLDEGRLSEKIPYSIGKMRLTSSVWRRSNNV